MIPISLTRFVKTLELRLSWQCKEIVDTVHNFTVGHWGAVKKEEVKQVSIWTWTLSKSPFRACSAVCQLREEQKTVGEVRSYTFKASSPHIPGMLSSLMQ